MNVTAVIFDWGGTLTPWHSVDLQATWHAYSQVYDPSNATELAGRLLAVETQLWARQRDTAGEKGTGHLDHVFDAVGIDRTAALHGQALAAYLQFWEPHTYADPDALPLLTTLRAAGFRIGVLSNTLWPREHHEWVFARDGLAHLIDGAVYTSETPWGKPHQAAFGAALAAVGVLDPANAVFVGDRIWDDIFGAQQAGMRAIWLPHSQLPPDQLVQIEVTPDAVVDRLADVLEVVLGWKDRID